jgi:hypothetical protein
MRYRALPVLAWAALLVGGACARDYSYELFTVEEVNKLRMATPVKCAQLHQQVVGRYTKSIQHAVQMRNWDRLVKLGDQLSLVMDFVLRDIRLCFDQPKNRNNKTLRQVEIQFRKEIVLLEGIQRDIPLVYREGLDPPIRKLTYARHQLFRFINNLDDKAVVE